MWDGASVVGGGIVSIGVDISAGKPAILPRVQRWTQLPACALTIIIRQCTVYKPEYPHTSQKKVRVKKTLLRPRKIEIKKN